MNKLCTSLALAALLVVSFGSLPTTTNASDDDIAISAHMRGLGEIPPTNSKSTNSKAVANSVVRSAPTAPPSPTH
jgi:hypothetical protein